MSVVLGSSDCASVRAVSQCEPFSPSVDFGRPGVVRAGAAEPRPGACRSKGTSPDARGLRRNIGGAGPVLLPVDHVRRGRRLARGVKAAAILAERVATPLRWVPWMFTLTYAKPQAWSPLHLSRCLDEFRRWMKAAGFPLLYVGVAEIQPERLKRTGYAVVHYHLVVWLPRWMLPPKLDDCGWWPHGMSQRIRARSPVAYLVAYARKSERGSELMLLLPKGCRAHMKGGLGELGRHYTHAMRPLWLRELVSAEERVVRVPQVCGAGGGWRSVVSGIVHECPFVVRRTLQGWVCVPKALLFSGWSIDSSADPLHWPVLPAEFV